MIREGDGPNATADLAMLAAIGLPGGGLLAVGSTVVRVVPGRVGIANELRVPPSALANSGVRPGATVDASRVVLPAASTVVLTGAGGTLDAIPQSLRGVPVRPGESFSTTEGTIVVDEVHPEGGAVITADTVPAGGVDTSSAPTDEPTEVSPMIAGLENELDLLTGWLALLTSDTAAASDGSVAGVVVTGPAGSGRSELTAAACEASGLTLRTVDLRTVTTPDRLLTRLEAAVTTAAPGTVISIERLDPLLDRESGVRHQAAAVVRWFLERTAGTPRVATVISTTRPSLAGDIDATDLLRRTLTIAPPSTERRMALLAAALGDTEDIDLDAVANATPGFSALDISTAVLEARARSTRLTTEALLEAVRNTRPSLGTIHLGDVPSYGFDEVANLTDVKRSLTENVIWHLTDPGRFERMGIEPAKGLLLYGPPGTGKTYVIRALAHESGAAFFSVKGAELLDKWVGESERGVREVFARARAVAPAIIFFDEIDALAPVRGSSTNNVTDSVVAAMLTELDGVGGRGDVFVVGATNRRDLVDPALLRPGRLEVHLLLDLPAPEARRAFFDMTSVPLDDSVDLDHLVEETDGMSFADLEGLLRSAAIGSLRRDAHTATVTRDDLAEALTTR